MLKTKTERPYRQEPLDQLRRLVQTACRRGDADGLRLVIHELGLRSTRAAATLLGEAQSALTSLRERPQPSAPKASDAARPAVPTPASPDGSEVVPQSGTEPGRPLEFDDEQREVINAAVNARLIVNAPPGTGKTAVACARITALLERGVPAHQIWLFSFTRTAVRELRNRIQGLSGTRPDVWAVKVATLDSRAWTLVQGFTATRLADRAGGHEQTILDAIELLRSGQDAIFDFLDEIAHVVVDEAQDLVGVRGTLVMELIARLPAGAGITVLTDDAQAIYGFAEEDDETGEQGTLPERLRAMEDSGFSEHELRHVYRTSSAGLTTLFIEGRRQVLGAISVGDGGSVRVVRECIARWNDGAAEPVRRACPPPETLQLYRTRMEVLDASCWLGGRGTAHRIRMSGLPALLHPWIGVALASHDAEFLTHDRFVQHWERVRDALGPVAPDPRPCWEAMVRVAPSGSRVCLPELRAVLARPRPPLEFTTDECGLIGPILGTIHASKGREADQVHLMLPREREDERDPDEEARVLFVGATRARRTLRVGAGDWEYSSPLSQGRRYKKLRSGAGVRCRARMEIGLEGDLDVYSPVSRALHSSAQEARGAQETLERSAACIEPVRAWRGGAASRWAYDVRRGSQQDGQLLGRLAHGISRSLKELRESWGGLRLKDPGYIGPLFQLTVRTIVADPASADTDELHDPWARSGVWLAPVIVGLPTIPFFAR